MGCSLVLFLLLPLAFCFPLPSSKLDNLSEGKSLSVEKPEEVLISPNGVFTAGFHSVGDNAFCFAIWFSTNSSSRTVVWMANRDHPVNGKRSKLSLLKTGNLILTDADKLTVWATNTVSLSPLRLSLHNTGNLVLHNMEGSTLWKSFDFPTDTLLPQQLFTRNTKLVSSRSQSNISSGFYELFFDNDNLLRLRYNGPELSSIYWFDPWLNNTGANRSIYNSSRNAVLDSLGNFISSDEFTFKSTDYGAKLHRRLTLDYDGNMRLYSWKEETQTWVVSWQVIQRPCTIHAICGINSLCNYVVDSGRKCSCLPGYKMKNRTDWAYGCEPEINLSYPCEKEYSDFMLLPHVQFYGYDDGFFSNYTFDQCRNLCLQSCSCKGFQYTYFWDHGYAYCFPKTLLLNGYRSPDYEGGIYLKVPKSENSSIARPLEEFNLSCSNKVQYRWIVF
jgi:hypothetical protein